mgnify:CR=1 FL=1
MALAFTVDAPRSFEANPGRIAFTSRTPVDALAIDVNGRRYLDLGTGIAANPYLVFHTVATASGNIEFFWHDDDGSIYTAKAAIEVA